MSSLYLVCNRGKRSIAVDLQTPAGLDIVRRLAADTDVLIQNFRPGVMDKLGLGYDDMRAINGDVVYVSLSGFGATGPYRDRSAVRHRDPGVRRPRGEPSRSRRRHPGVPAADRRRQGDRVVRGAGDQRRAVRAERGKGGQHIELSMMDAVVSFLWADSAANEVLLEADGSQLSSFVAGFRPLRFTDGWGIVTPTSDHDFAGMCRALGVDGYDDPRVATIGERMTEPRDDGGRSSRGATRTPRRCTWPTRARASRPSVSRSR